MAEEETTNIIPLMSDNSPRNFMASTPKHNSANSKLSQGNDISTPSLPLDSTKVQEILHSLPSVCQFLQNQSEHTGYGTEGDDLNSDSYDKSGKHFNPGYRMNEMSMLGSQSRRPVNMSQNASYSQAPNYQHQDTLASQTLISNSNQKVEPKIQKEKKSITTKTFAKGMMDVSLLTSNATQLRAVMSTPDHEFYTLLLWLITLSVTLQILSSVLMIMSDFFKTQVKEMDRQNQRKRKILNFLSLALITIVTSLNVLISAFYSPGTISNRQSGIPQFSPASIMTNKHTDL